MPKKNVVQIVQRPRGLYSVAEAAVYLGITEGTLRNWVSMKRVAYVKIGDRTMFTQADLDAYIAAHRVAAVNA
jgi:excisionase family DNA binding protein